MEYLSEGPFAKKEIKNYPKEKEMNVWWQAEKIQRG